MTVEMPLQMFQTAMKRLLKFAPDLQIASFN